MHDEGGPLEDRELARRFAAGDETAVRDLYREHGALVFSMCLSALRHRQDAEDAAQQVFTRAWRSRATYDVSRPIGAWLTGITRRVISDMLDHRRRSPQAVDAAAAPEARAADGPADAMLDRIIIQEALDELGPPQDEILRMAYTDDLPLRTIAEQLDMPLGTVKSHIHRGLAKMRTRLGGAT